MEKEKMIEELIKQEQLWFKEIETQGVKAWMDLFTKDVIVIDWKHKPNIVGEKDTEIMLEEVYSRNGFNLEMETISADISDDFTFGYTIGKYLIKYIHEEKLVSQIGKYLFIWKKINGEWKVSLDMLNAHIER